MLWVIFLHIAVPQQYFGETLPFKSKYLHFSLIKAKILDVVGKISNLKAPHLVCLDCSESSCILEEARKVNRLMS